jgi:glycerophosphoryl diester phosphodiesterase
MLIHYLRRGLGRSFKKFSFAALLSLLVLSASGCYISALIQLKRLDPAPSLKTVVVAHRGSLHKAEDIDNSIPTLKRTILSGIDNLEVDVRQAKDGELFLFHDGSLNKRNSFAPDNILGAPISSLTSELRSKVKLDKLGQVGIPTLTQALDLISEHPSSTLQLDLKGESDSLTLAVLNLISSRGLLSRSLIQIRSVERAKLVLSRWPKARILIRCKDEATLESALKLPIEAVELERWITSSAVKEAHAKNILVALNLATSSFDTPEMWRYLNSRGVDMMMTDYPREVLGGVGGY